MDLNLTYKANFVPMLSRREIEKIAQSVLSEIQPECLKEPQSTDLDFLIRGFLKMNYEEQYLSNNALFLGLTVFKADKVIIFNPEIRRAEYFPAKDNTIFIEKSLCGDEESLGRKRFTQAHEAGHALFHRRYYEGKGRGDYQTGSEEENSSYESPELLGYGLAGMAGQRLCLCRADATSGHENSSEPLSGPRGRGSKGFNDRGSFHTF